MKAKSKIRPKSLPARMAGLPTSSAEARKRGLAFFYELDSKTNLINLVHLDDDWFRVVGRYSPNFPNESEYEMAIRLWCQVPDHAPVPKQEMSETEVHPLLRPLPQQPQIETDPRTKNMRLEHSDAVKLLKALGHDQCDKWGHGRMAQQLERYKDIDQKEAEKLKTKIKDKEIRNLFESVLTTLEEDRGITVIDDADRQPSPGPTKGDGKKSGMTIHTGLGQKYTVAADVDEDDADGEEPDEEESEEEETGDEGGEEEPESEEEVEEVVVSKKSAAKPSPKKKPPAKARPSAKKRVKEVGTDEFGAKVGTDEWRINAPLLNFGEAMTVDDVSEIVAFGSAIKESVIKAHLDKLVKSGKLACDKGGKYSLKSNTRTSAS